MKCPLCNIEARIQSNELVKKKDGTLAYRMQFVCRSKQCPNNGKVFHTEYDEVKPIEE